MRATAISCLMLASGEAFIIHPTLGAPPTVRSSINNRAPVLEANFLAELFGGGKKTFDAPVVMGTEEMMSQKEFGTSAVPIQKNLRWSCDVKTADNICNYNRHYAEFSGYWERATTFLQEESQNTEEITFYDSNTGKPLFFGPRGRSWKNFVKESQVHGWPSFRDSEVNWEHVRVLPNGECISVDGTHLGHNLPDRSGNRYCASPTPLTLTGTRCGTASDRSTGPRAYSAADACACWLVPPRYQPGECRRQAFGIDALELLVLALTGTRAMKFDIRDAASTFMARAVTRRS